MIKLKLNRFNPLTLTPLIAKEQGYFDEENLEVEVELFKIRKPFQMDDTTANVGDVTRIFELVYNGLDMVITSDLTRTMKLILRDEWQNKDKLDIIISPNQSLGIYGEEFFKELGIDYNIVSGGNVYEREVLLKSGEIDGALMIDPFLIPFINHGYQLVFEGKNHIHNYTCWAFRKSYADKYPQNVLAFHSALNKAGQYFNSLSYSEKIDYAKHLLSFEDNLDDYYGNFVFEEDREYSSDALHACFNWKIKQDEYLKSLLIDNLIFKWSK